VPAKDSKLLANGIERLIIDERLRENLGDGGYKRFKEGFTVERMIEKTNEIYKSLI
jgi:glycosyltransferase involved in cell wall biosynthesis